MSLADILARHRGPYRLAVTRPGTKAPTSEFLSGLVESEDVETDARALLDDPRDSILTVHVWSDREQQYVTTLRRETDV